MFRIWCCDKVLCPVLRHTTLTRVHPILSIFIWIPLDISFAGTIYLSVSWTTSTTQTMHSSFIKDKFLLFLGVHKLRCQNAMDIVVYQTFSQSNPSVLSLYICRSNSSASWHARYSKRSSFSVLQLFRRETSHCVRAYWDWCTSLIASSSFFSKVLECSLNSTLE